MAHAKEREGREGVDPDQRPGGTAGAVLRGAVGAAAAGAGGDPQAHPLNNSIPAFAGEGDRAERGGGVLQRPKNPSTMRSMVPLPRKSWGGIIRRLLQPPDPRLRPRRAEEELGHRPDHGVGAVGAGGGALVVAADGEVGELVLEGGEAAGEPGVAGLEEGGDRLGAAGLGGFGEAPVDSEADTGAAGGGVDQLAAPIAFGDG